MTPKQRLAGFLKGESIYRRPIMPMPVMVAGKVAGITYREKHSARRRLLGQRERGSPAA